MSSDDKQDDTRVAIFDGPFSVDETDQPFGKRWGGECFTLTAEHWPHCKPVKRWRWTCKMNTPRL